MRINGGGETRGAKTFCGKAAGFNKCAPKERKRFTENPAKHLAANGKLGVCETLLLI